jgi:hypothetical protein
MSERDDSTGPTQEQVDQARKDLARPHDDDADPQAADGTTRDVAAEPDADGGEG